MNAIYQFDITGDGGGVARKTRRWRGFRQRWPAESPSITLTATDANWSISFRANRVAAFLTGKLKIKGDMGLAMKLQNVFSLGK